MTASNHFLAGATIGAVIGNPWIALPAAIASHFVLDALPHYGYEGEKELRRAGFTLFQWVLILDVLMFFAVCGVVLFGLQQPELLLFGLAAYSPDLLWVYRFSIKEHFGHRAPDPMNWLGRFHAGIQKLESPWGIFVEIPFFIGLLVTLIMIG